MFPSGQNQPLKTTNANEQMPSNEWPFLANIAIPVLSEKNKKFTMSELCADIEATTMVQTELFEGQCYYILEVTDFHARRVDQILWSHWIAEYSAMVEDKLHVAPLEYEPNGALGAPDGEPSTGAQRTNTDPSALTA